MVYSTSPLVVYCTSPHSVGVYVGEGGDRVFTWYGESCGVSGLDGATSCIRAGTLESLVNGVRRQLRSGEDVIWDSTE